MGMELKLSEEGREDIREEMVGSPDPKVPVRVRLITDGELKRKLRRWGEWSE